MLNNEGRRGIMVAELEHHAGLLIRRAARLQADIELHLRAADRLERCMERFSIVDLVTFTEARQKAEKLNAALRALQDHWRVSQAIVDHDILHTLTHEVGSKESDGPGNAPDPGSGEANH